MTGASKCIRKFPTKMVSRITSLSYEVVTQREPAVIRRNPFSVLVELQRMPVLILTVTSTAAMTTSATQAQLGWSAFFWPCRALFSLSFVKRCRDTGRQTIQLLDN